VVAFLAFIFLVTENDIIESIAILGYSMLCVVGLVDYEVMRRELIQKQRWVPPSWARIMEYIVFLGIFSMGTWLVAAAVYKFQDLTILELLVFLIFGLMFMIISIIGIWRVRKFGWCKLHTERKY
jgi:hypothetical protein